MEQTLIATTPVKPAASLFAGSCFTAAGCRQSLRVNVPRKAAILSASNEVISGYIHDNVEHWCRPTGHQD